VHKCVLKRRSAKFDCVFKVKSEASTKKNKSEKIVVKNHTFDTVKEALMFCYDIQNSDSLSAQDAADLMKFANEYQIMDLKKKMEEFCNENISVTNVVCFSTASIIVDSDELYQKCFDFLLKCMKDGTAVKDVEELDENMQKELFLQTFTKTCKD
uniref:BTB domain-containing protein n=1 Tax=Panagrolaimus sp. ES5 TaxID=591445 RepID=A0AC34FKB2_9BILA